MSFIFANTMSTSSSKKCVPCESLDSSMLLSVDKVQEELTSLPLWSLSSDDSTNHAMKISRTFTAKNFQCALDAMNDVGKIAEREGHHPDLHITSYRNVEIVLYTHSVGGVTENDLTMAKNIEKEVTFTYSPKWLKENPMAKH